jgi:hypothetical protein
METAKELIRFYGAYLYKNKNLQLSPERRFWITNTAIGKKKLQNRCTIYRHLLILKEAGVILNKIWHGSNWGIEVEINPEVLAIKQSFSETINKVLNFADSLPGALQQDNVATFSHNDSGQPQETINLNMHRENVQSTPPKGFLTVQTALNHLFGRKQGSMDIGESPKPLPEIVDNLQAGTAGNFSKGRAAQMNLFANAIWRFSLPLLWKGKTFSELDEKLSKQYIREYFELIPEKSYEKLSNVLFEGYLERILLTKKYIDRSPERFVPPPTTWFDRHFKDGFAGTLSWQRQVHEKRKQNKFYLSNLKLCASLVRRYITEPSLHSFKAAEKVLSGKKDNKLMDIFYTCIQDISKFTPELFQTYITA